MTWFPSLLSPLLLAAAAGAVLGLAYLGALWLTVRHLGDVAHPALLALASLVARMALLVTGFYVLVGGGASRLLAGLAGFLVVRTVLVRRMGRGATAGSAGSATAPRGEPGGEPWS